MPQPFSAFSVRTPVRCLIACAALTCSASHAQTVRTVSTVTLTYSASSTDGTGAVLQALVAGSAPTGRVSFELADGNGATVVCTDVPLANARANCTIPVGFKAAGTRRYQAHYSGDTTNTPAAATTTALITNGTGVFGAQVLPATVTLTTNPIRPRAGEPFSVIATVVSGVAGGAASFRGVPNCNVVIALPLPGSETTSVTTCRVTSASAGPLDVAVDFAGGLTDPPVTGSGSARIVVLPASGPRDYTDMWWAGKIEDGWGMSITQHGDTQFNALYVYDSDGSPIWYVMPGGTWDTGFTRYTGLLYQPRGAPFFAYETSALNVGSSVGSATIEFTSSAAATLSYTINGISGSKRIERQAFGTSDSATRLQVNDLWWAGAAQNGWGINIAQSDRTLFAVWYTYDANGRATWYVMPGGEWRGADYVGKLYATQGSAWLGSAYVASRLQATEVGAATLAFLDGGIATANLRVGAFTIERLLFRQPY